MGGGGGYTFLYFKNLLFFVKREFYMGANYTSANYTGANYTSPNYTGVNYTSANYTSMKLEYNHFLMHYSFHSLENIFTIFIYEIFCLFKRNLLQQSLSNCKVICCLTVCISQSILADISIDSWFL